MQSLTAQLQQGGNLEPPQIEEAVAFLTGNAVDDPVKADFLRALREKGETAAEIAGFVRALLVRAVDPGLEPARLPGPMLDVCGTGGDRLELFNVSTTSMFVLAAGGVAMVKHGNRAVTSKCGAADVLEELGIRIDLPPAALRRCVESLGVCFLFAPAYHPAFQAIGPVRKLLAAQGVPTIFNLLGPLLNPARPPHQLVGIFTPTLLPKYAAALQALGRHRAWAVHGNGMDEIATTGPTEVHDVTPSGLATFTIEPETLGLAPASIADLRGGDRVENAQILRGILNGTVRGAKREMVELNAAAGFVIAGLVRDLAAGLEHARRQLDSGSALVKLQKLRSFRAE